MLTKNKILMWKTQRYGGAISGKPVDNYVENGNCYKFVICVLFYCNKGCLS